MHVATQRPKKRACHHAFVDGATPLATAPDMHGTGAKILPQIIILRDANAQSCCFYWYELI